MTNSEVVNYLNHNDIIFIPVGTVEMHGQMPLDCEYTAPEAMALLMAEEVDGLVLDGLKYFYCGATTIGRGTVQMSVRKGYDYLKEIALSLMNQGFRRQIYVTGHGPSYLTVGSMVVDFFDETKLPVTWVDFMTAVKHASKKMEGGFDTMKSLNNLFFGAYEILNRKDELVINPDIVVEERRMELPPSMKNVIPLIQFGNFECATGFYFGDESDHGGNHGAFRSIEERDEVCALGAEQFRELVKLMDIPNYVQCLRNQDQYTNTVIKDKFGAHLPKMKNAEWK